MTSSLAREFSDFDVRVLARAKKSEYREYYGLIFRREDSENYYIFMIDPTAGKFRLRIQENDIWSTIVAWTGSPYIDGSGASNEVRVVARGNTINLYINGEMVSSVTHSSFKSGRVALYARNGFDPQGTEVFFDDLRVYGTAPYIATPTPVPTAIPLPPGTSKLLYFEGFEDPTSGWSTAIRETYERGYVKGEYRILVKNINRIIRATGPDSFTDFDLRVQARYEGGLGGKAYGVLFRCVDEDNFYVWWVNPVSGSHRLQKQVSDRWTTLIGWGSSPLIKPRSEPMELRVVARGSRFDFYVDGALVVNNQDTSFWSGRVGVYAWNDVDQEGAEMFFDNLRVFELK